jgi:tetratricopeptide (TPR) repeat protein
MTKTETETQTTAKMGQAEGGDQSHQAAFQRSLGQLKRIAIMLGVIFFTTVFGVISVGFLVESQNSERREKAEREVPLLMEEAKTLLAAGRKREAIARLEKATRYGDSPHAKGAKKLLQSTLMTAGRQALNDGAFPRACSLLKKAITYNQGSQLRDAKVLYAKALLASAPPPKVNPGKTVNWLSDAIDTLMGGGDAGEALNVRREAQDALLDAGRQCLSQGNKALAIKAVRGIAVRNNTARGKAARSLLTHLRDYETKSRDLKALERYCDIAFEYGKRLGEPMNCWSRKFSMELAVKKWDSTEPTLSALWNQITASTKGMSPTTKKACTNIADSLYYQLQTAVLWNISLIKRVLRQTSPLKRIKRWNEAKQHAQDEVLPRMQEWVKDKEGLMGAIRDLARQIGEADRKLSAFFAAPPVDRSKRKPIQASLKRYSRYLSPLCPSKPKKKKRPDRTEYSWSLNSKVGPHVRLYDDQKDGKINSIFILAAVEGFQWTPSVLTMISTLLYLSSGEPPDTKAAILTQVSDWIQKSTPGVKKGVDARDLISGIEIHLSGILANDGATFLITMGQVELHD